MICIFLLFLLMGICILVDILERGFSWTLPFIESLYSFTVWSPAFNRFLRQLYLCFFLM